MKRVRLGVIGVGALGQHHARIVAGLADAELVAVVDSREAQGRAVAEKHGTRWLASPAELHGQVDGVIVAVPTTAHLAVARPFLEQGTAVLVEKPLADSLEAAVSLRNIARFRRSLLQVGHVERFNPAFELLREKIGRPLHIRCQRYSPYTFRSTDIGVVHDLMIHDIDLVLALTGGSVERVEAFGAVAIGPHEDLANARLQLSGGVMVDLAVSRINPAVERSIQVWSTCGYAAADLQTRKVTCWRPCPALAANPGMVQDIVSVTPNPLSLKDEVFSKWIQCEESQASSADALTAELQNFVDCIRTGEQPRVNGDAAVAAMDVADRVLDGMSGWSWQSAGPIEEVRRAA
jgi:predicted dehydrogenase